MALRSVVVASLVGVAACGGGSPAAPDAAIDGSVDAAVAVPLDAPSDPFPLGQNQFLKASNVVGFGLFGESIALSADGLTLAVGADAEASASTGINGNQFGGGATESGAVYVFVRSSSADPWVQQAYIKASNTHGMDRFGFDVALSSDGMTLAVGAYNEFSDATGVGGDQTDHSAGGAGAVYVFTRAGTTWTQQAYLKASNTETGDEFGYAVALDSDGSTLAVGAFHEASGSAGIGADQSDNTAPVAGAVYVFTRAGVMWAQQAYVKASNPAAYDCFGISVALSSDGNLLAVGAEGEVNGAPHPQMGAGAVYMFSRTSATWAQQAYLIIDSPDPRAALGASVGLSSDGSELVAGAPGAHATMDAAEPTSGAAYVFTRAGTTWTKQAEVVPSNAGGEFGTRVAVSADGKRLVVSAPGERSDAVGLDGVQIDETDPSAGAAYAFSGFGPTWVQRHYIKAFNTGPADGFGMGLAISGDGATVAIGAIDEASDAANDPASNLYVGAGAAYSFQ